MRSLRMTAFRVALAGTLFLLGFSTKTQAAAPPEKIFPDTAAFFLKANDLSALREAFLQSQYGQLLADPAPARRHDGERQHPADP